MTPFIQFIIILSIIILSAKVAGWASTKLGQPSVLGELIVGLILGQSLLDITHLGIITDIHIPEEINHMAEIGVLLLMFLAGLELHLSDLLKNTKISAYAGLLGVFVPVGFGAAVGLFYEMSINQALFLGLALGATSVSISAQTLMELGKLRSRVGLGLLGSAVFDDIVVILLLSSFLGLINEGGSFSHVALVILRMMLFIVAFSLFGYWLFPRISRRVSRLAISQGLPTLALIFILVYGYSAEILGGMAAITGSFLAGLMFARTVHKQEIENGIRALAYSFFVPVFFVNIGLGVDLRILDTSILWLIVIITTTAILGKILGSGIGAKIGGLSSLESLQLGIGMISRGEVGLIVAKIGLDNGLITPSTFSAVVVMIIVTTLITPVLLRASYRSQKAGHSQSGNI